MRAKKNIFLIMLFSLVITILKISSIEGIYKLDQYVLVNFQYMSKNSLINIYENSIFILPYLIINIFNFLEIRSFFDNKIFLVSRFGTVCKYNLFMLKKAFTIVLRNVCTYFMMVIIISLVYTGFSFSGFMNIVFCFINIVLIELFFCFIFYFFLGIFTSQYCYLLGIIITILSSISGFLAKYLENDYLFDSNFMTKNVSLKISGLMDLKFDYICTIIMIFITLIAVLILHKVKEET